MSYGFWDRLVDLIELTRRKGKEAREKRTWTLWPEGAFEFRVKMNRAAMIEYVNNTLGWNIDSIDEDTGSVLCSRKKERTISSASSTQSKE